MKVYSKSQGKVIDMPQAQMGQAQMGGAGSGLGELGGASPLQKVIGLGALSKGQYGTAWNVLESLIKKPQDATDALKELSDLKYSVKQAVNYVKVNPGAAGWRPFERLERAEFGPFKLPKGRVQLGKQIADVAGKQAFTEAGKAFTRTEREVLQGKIPDVSYGPDYLQQQLNEILRDIENKELYWLYQQYGE